jgi:hypothetical protein
MRVSRHARRNPCIEDRAYFLCDDLGVTQLPDYPGAKSTRYLCINDDGKLLGNATLGNGGPVAFIASPRH